MTKPTLKEFLEPMLTARDVVSKWYADKRHDTQMSGAAQELLIEAVADALAAAAPRSSRPGGKP